MKIKKKVRSAMSKKKDKHIAYDNAYVDPNSWVYNYAAKQEKDNEEREEAVMSKKSANSTINWIKGAVICAVFLTLVVIFINLLTVRVPAGYAAAQGDANAKVIAAQAEADANAKINSSITDQLIRMKEAEARLKHGWVTVQGSDTVVTKDADSDK